VSYSQNTTKNVSVSMLSCSDIQKIQPLANKPLLSQFLESVCSQCSTLTKVIRYAPSRLQSQSARQQ